MPALNLPVDVAELDVETGPKVLIELRQVIAAANRYDVELDFSAVGFLDSSGLGNLIALKLFIDDHGGQLAVVNVQKRPCRVFRAAGLLDVFGVHCEHG